MSNTYFQFKQFTIHQDQCAMKVSTDACIQGAWTPIPPNTKHVLDIGAGTGLLSLMLAQRNPEILIDAIELDPAAARQASENSNNSQYNTRINIINHDVTTYPFTTPYDLIICNPPFFNNSLLGNTNQRNLARHTLALSFDQLFEVIKNILAPTGYASILLPSSEHQLWEMIINKNNWKIHDTLQIIPRTHQLPNRLISVCTPPSNSTQQPSVQQLTIRQEDNQYTSCFTHLLQPFYLKL